MKLLLLPGIFCKTRKCFPSLTELKGFTIYRIEWTEIIKYKPHELVDVLIKKYNLVKDNYCIIGYSLGGTIALDIDTKVRAHKMFLISTFRSKEELMNSTYLIFNKSIIGFTVSVAAKIFSVLFPRRIDISGTRFTTWITEYLDWYTGPEDKGSLLKYKIASEEYFASSDEVKRITTLHGATDFIQPQYIYDDEVVTMYKDVGHFLPMTLASTLLLKVQETYR